VFVVSFRFPQQRWTLFPFCYSDRASWVHGLNALPYEETVRPVNKHHHPTPPPQTLTHPNPPPPPPTCRYYLRLPRPPRGRRGKHCTFPVVRFPPAPCHLLDYFFPCVFGTFVPRGAIPLSFFVRLFEEAASKVGEAGSLLSKFFLGSQSSPLLTGRSILVPPPSLLFPSFRCMVMSRTAKIGLFIPFLQLPSVIKSLYTPVASCKMAILDLRSFHPYPAPTLPAFSLSIHQEYGTDVRFR